MCARFPSVVPLRVQQRRPFGSWRVPAGLCLLACWLLTPTAAYSVDILQTQTEHLARLAVQPEAGTPLLIDFNNQPFSLLPPPPSPNPFANDGIEFITPPSLSLAILPEAFGSLGIAIPLSECLPGVPLPCPPHLLVPGFLPGSTSELIVRFDEPQRYFAAFFVDGDPTPLNVEVFLNGALDESFSLPAEGEQLDGGVFRALWFSSFADELRITSGINEDGFGLDNTNSAVPGSVDNDLDGFSENDLPVGDCDDANPLVNPAEFDSCDDVDTDCNGIVDDGNDNDGDTIADCAGDCDDTDATVFPGAQELCNGVDNDCDGEVDNADDQDGDGFTPCDIPGNPAD